MQGTPKGVSMRAAILRDDSGILNIEDVTIDKPDRKGADQDSCFRAMSQ